MLRTANIFRKKKENDNVYPFQVIDGGLAQPKVAGQEPPFYDWLTEMTPNTVFLAKEKKNKSPVCTEFTVLNHSDKCVKLQTIGDPFWVVPGGFCQGMDLIDVLQRGYSDRGGNDPE